MKQHYFDIKTGSEINHPVIINNIAQAQPARPSNRAPARRRGESKPKRRPLAGKSLLVITDGKPGMEVQCLGVARALGCEPTVKQMAPRWLWRLLAPWGPPDPRDRIEPPWPDIAIATGRQSVPALRALAKAAGPDTYTVVIQNPRTGSGTADLICVPRHDRLSGANVFTTLTSPHTFPPSDLDRLRMRPPRAVAALSRPLIAVILGGPNAVYRFSEADEARLARSVAAMARLGASFLITPSRRTPDSLIEAVLEATKGAKRFVWTGGGGITYAQLLAAGDQFVVTADSVNMTGEACATGRPVYVFKPSGGSAKFAWFHESLRQYGATRPLPETFNALENWSYEPLDAAAAIAREIERRWRERATTRSD